MRKPGAGLVLVALLAAAGGHAWGQGRSGDSLLAPTKENFERALNAAINPAAAQTACLWLPLSDPSPERAGIPGLRQEHAPGQFSVTFATGLRPSVPYEKRQEQLRKFDALVRAGFFQESGTTVTVDNSPPIPARQFTLTWKGWEQMSPDTPCFPYGRFDALRVVDAVQLPPHPSGLDMWEVTYQRGLSGVPEWSKDEGLRAAFGELRNSWAAPSKMRLIRGKSDWLTEAQIQAAARNPELAQIARKLDEAVPNPADSTVSAAIDRYLSAEPRYRPRACFRLPYQDADESSAWEALPAAKALHLDFYVEAGRSPERQAARDAALVRMRALETAGLARSEALPATTVRGRQVQGGMRFVVAPELNAHMSRESPWCVIFGDWRVAAIITAPAEPGKRAERRAKVRYELTNERAWVRKVPLRELPELRVVLEHGLAAAASLVYQDTQWRVSTFKTYEPQTTPWDRQTIVLAPGTHALITGSSGDVHIVQGTAPMEDIQRITGSPPAPSIQRQDVPQLHQQPDPVPPPEFRVGATPLHVVAVYEGERRSGSPAGRVEVRIAHKGAPAVLLLSANDPVEWNVVIEKGAALERIMVVGSGRQEVVGVSGAIPVFIRSRVQNPGLGGLLRVTRQTTRGEILDNYDSVRALTGTNATTLQTSYTGGVFIVDGVRTVVKPKPLSQGAAPASSVVFQEAMSTKVFNSGLSVAYCCAGASSVARASHGHVTGKVYFEMTLRLPGSEEAGSYTGIGLTIEGSEGIVVQVPIFNALKKYKDKVTFGIAADLQASRLYAHANGEWIYGPPGHNGIPFKVASEREVFAAVRLSAWRQRGESETWTANFGATPFLFPVPADFLPYASPAGPAGRVAR